MKLNLLMEHLLLLQMKAVTIKINNLSQKYKKAPSKMKEPFLLSAFYTDTKLNIFSLLTLLSYHLQDTHQKYNDGLLCL